MRNILRGVLTTETSTEMAFSNSVATSILVFVLLIGYVQSEAPLNPFGKEAKNDIPQDMYKKLFPVNKDSNQQLPKAVEESVKKFDEIIGSKTDKSLTQQLVNEAKRLGDAVNASLRFHVHANSVGQTAKDNGKLNPGNVKEMAQKWVDELDKSAKSLKNTNVISTFSAIYAANARFFKSLGLTSKDISNQFIKNLINEVKKY